MKKKYIKPSITVLEKDLEFPINCSCHHDNQRGHRGHRPCIKIIDSQDDFYSEEDDFYSEEEDW